MRRTTRAEGETMNEPMAKEDGPDPAPEAPAFLSR